jgi:hypothetical protein
LLVGRDQVREDLLNFLGDDAYAEERAATVEDEEPEDS